MLPMSRKKNILQKGTNKIERENNKIPKWLRKTY